MRQSDRVMSIIKKHNENEIFSASSMYCNTSLKNSVNEINFYKILERLVKQKTLSKVSKGIYYIPEQSKYGNLSLSEDELLAQLLQHTEYIEIGYGLYNKYGLTTQISKKRVFYVEKLQNNQQKIKNIFLYKCSINYKNSEHRKMIEVFEILQNFYSIQDLNTHAFFKHIKKFASGYDNKVLDDVLKTTKYKKSTLAFLKALLGIYGVENNINNHLSSLSKYKIPDLSSLNETTS